MAYACAHDQKNHSTLGSATHRKTNRPPIKPSHHNTTPRSTSLTARRRTFQNRYATRSRTRIVAASPRSTLPSRFSFPRIGLKSSRAALTRAHEARETPAELDTTSAVQPVFRRDAPSGSPARRYEQYRLGYAAYSQRRRRIRAHAARRATILRGMRIHD